MNTIVSLRFTLNPERCRWNGFVSSHEISRIYGHMKPLWWFPSFWL